MNSPENRVPNNAPSPNRSPCLYFNGTQMNKTSWMLIMFITAKLYRFLHSRYRCTTHSNHIIYKVYDAMLFWLNHLKSVGLSIMSVIFTPIRYHKCLIKYVRKIFSDNPKLFLTHFSRCTIVRELTVNCKWENYPQNSQNFFKKYKLRNLLQACIYMFMFVDY